MALYISQLKKDRQIEVHAKLIQRMRQEPLELKEKIYKQAMKNNLDYPAIIQRACDLVLPDLEGDEGQFLAHISSGTAEVKEYLIEFLAWFRFEQEKLQESFLRYGRVLIRWLLCLSPFPF